MKKLLALSFVLGLNGCASIISGSNQSVSIDSTPSRAEFSITNSDGVLVQSGVTPAKVMLDTGSGYFTGETYTVKFIKDDNTATSVLDTELNNWYFGNLLIGGALGMLVVDPITGAMYTLPNSLNVNLK